MIHAITDSTAYSEQLDLAALRKLLQHDDWSKLTEEEFGVRYLSLCSSLDLDFREKPIEFVRYPDGRYGPYIPARTSFALAAKRHVSTRYERMTHTRDEFSVVITAFGEIDGAYHEVTRQGTVSLRNRTGQDRANGMMHAETKASRRAILAFLKLGFLDESEVRDIEGAERYTGDDLANTLDESDPATVSYGELVHFKCTAREKGWRRSEWLALLSSYGWSHEGAIRKSMLSEVLAALSDPETKERHAAQSTTDNHR